MDKNTFISSLKARGHYRLISFLFSRRSCLYQGSWLRWMWKGARLSVMKPGL